MKMISEYAMKGSDRTARVLYSHNKQEYLVQLNDERQINHKFYTEQEAEDFAEDWVMGTANEEVCSMVDSGKVTLTPVPPQVKVDIKWD